MQVYIVDDDDFALMTLEHTLTTMGYTVACGRNGKEAIEQLRKGEFRLVITDWDMPEMNGLDLCRAIRQEDLSGYVYVVMLTGREGAKQRMEGLCAGADAFLNKPLDPEELLVSLKTAERILALETRDVALFALAKLAESRDAETGAHIERVQSYTRLIARHLAPEVRTRHGIDDEYVRLLFQTSPLHDLGKVGIPDSILLKPGKLTSDEFEVMKTHTVVGAETLDAALQRFPNARFLQVAREIALSHHEKFDGSGYPRGLAGQQIPMCGRIVAVADVYDALTSRRVYKDASSHADAVVIIRGDRGRHFDPDVVDAFLRAEEQIVSVYERLRDEPHEPASAAFVEEAAPVESVAQPTPGSCPILVAEDDPLMRQRLLELLSATGERVFVAADGNEAFRLWLEHSPRVIVSDWVMPNSDGVQLCRRIRDRAQVGATHFIMLTAHSEKYRLLEAYDAGVDDFVAKPFDYEELLARVRAGIRASKLHDELVRKATGSQALNAQLAALNSRLERLSITDELTGLFNRRHAVARMEEYWAASERYGRPLTIASIDMDGFKQINDTYGHDAGDAVIRKVAAVLHDQVRGSDVLARVGGDEFLIIFQNQTIKEAAICAERCRQTVAAHTFKFGETDSRVTISVGLASRIRSMADFAELLKAGDDALYDAKRAGRHTVRVAKGMQPLEPMPEKPPQVTNTGEMMMNTPANIASVTGAPISLEAVIKRCSNDADFAAMVLKRFSNTAGGEVKKLQDALAAADAAAVQRIAHSLKSMTAYVAADSASQIARELEELGRSNDLATATARVESLHQEIDRITAWITQNTAQPKPAATK